MQKLWLTALRCSALCLILVSGLYTAAVRGMALLTPQQGLGERIIRPDGSHWYANVAQPFSADRYFWPRPSAVDYNAAGSGGSNKGPSNPEYLQLVSDRIDSFAAHHRGIARSSIPSELVTASGSGLDPDISPEAAAVQVQRIAIARHISVEVLRQLLAEQSPDAAFPFAPRRVNVLRLNLRLDALMRR